MFTKKKIFPLHNDLRFILFFFLHVNQMNLLSFVEKDKSKTDCYFNAILNHREREREIGSTRDPGLPPVLQLQQSSGVLLPL